MMEVSKFTQDVFWLGPFSVCQLAIEATPGHLSVHQGLPCFSAASSVECSLLAEVWLHFSNLRIWVAVDAAPKNKAEHATILRQNQEFIRYLMLS
ncbi:OLC1v1001820C1 [Oldenlandia corymbosa var. corymbosa]|uniref:OLC1v1001820C1 n=1 Tax=Oldenlandia corymbosa var. corymbosa TaxID=529605 RepID=A0AAV1D6V2_OLDCO|nr:OLC1v1001820C1 [Oldenlandia corymbosa var. corymbosa]